MGLLDDIEAEELEESTKTLRKTVPGYDYRQKEKRAETDRKLREKITREIKKTRSNLDSVSDMAYDDGKRGVVEEISEVIDSLMKLEKKAESSPQGGRVGKIDSSEEEDMIGLLEKDAKLVRDAETLSGATDELEQAVIEGKTEGIEKRLRELRKTTDDVERTFEGRKDLIKGL